MRTVRDVYEGFARAARGRPDLTVSRELAEFEAGFMAGWAARADDARLHALLVSWRSSGLNEPADALKTALAN